MQVEHAMSADSYKSMRSVMAAAFVLGLALWFSSAALAQTTDQMSYDALGRLTRVQTSTATTVYSYDAAGNRTVVSVTASAPEAKPARPVVVVPSGGGYLVIPLKIGASA